MIEECALRRIWRAIRVAYTDGHLIGQLTLRAIGECGGCLLQIDPFQQDILIQARELRRIELASERSGNPLDGFAFAVITGAIGKGGEQRDRENGVLFGRRHGGHWMSLRAECSGGCHGATQGRETRRMKKRDARASDHERPPGSNPCLS